MVRPRTTQGTLAVLLACAAVQAGPTSGPAGPLSALKAVAADVRPLPPGAVRRLGRPGLRHTSYVNDLLYCRDGKLLFSAGHDGRDGRVRIWNAHTDMLLTQVHFGARWVYDIDLSPDESKLAVAACDGFVFVLDLVRRRRVFYVRAHSSHASTVLFTPDGGHIVTGGWDGWVCVLDASNGRTLRRFRPDPISTVYALALAPDGQTIAAGGGHAPADAPKGAVRSIHLLDLATGEPLRAMKLADANDAVFHLRFSPDGKRLLASSYTDQACLWDVATGRKIHTLKDEWGCGVGAAFAAGGRELLVGRDNGTVVRWDAATGKVLHRHVLRHDRGTVQSIALSPDGRHLGTFGGHEGAATQLAFGPDGRLLATGGHDAVVYLWDVAAGCAGPAGTAWQSANAYSGHGDCWYPPSLEGPPAR